MTQLWRNSNRIEEVIACTRHIRFTDLEHFGETWLLPGSKTSKAYDTLGQSTLSVGIRATLTFGFLVNLRPAFTSNNWTFLIGSPWILTYSDFVVTLQIWQHCLIIIYHESSTAVECLYYSSIVFVITVYNTSLDTRKLRNCVSLSRLGHEFMIF